MLSLHIYTFTHASSIATMQVVACYLLQTSVSLHGPPDMESHVMLNTTHHHCLKTHTHTITHTHYRHTDRQTHRPHHTHRILLTPSLNTNIKFTPPRVAVQTNTTFYTTCHTSHTPSLSVTHTPILYLMSLPSRET